MQLCTKQLFSISIHAPTRGATGNPYFSQTSANISIHAPTRGATIILLLFICCSIFQSTLPREERHSQTMHQPTCQTISIHAPTRGATRFYFFRRVPFSHFNPRSHERSDLSTTISCIRCIISIHAPTRGATLACTIAFVSLLFQSTLPREERQPTPLVCPPMFENFNPRSHERSDNHNPVYHQV